MSDAHDLVSFSYIGETNNLSRMVVVDNILLFSSHPSPMHGAFYLVNSLFPKYPLDICSSCILVILKGRTKTCIELVINNNHSFLHHCSHPLQIDSLSFPFPGCLYLLFICCCRFCGVFMCFQLFLKKTSNSS